MLGPAPSASGEPSIWYAEVALPQRKSGGNSMTAVIVIRRDCVLPVLDHQHCREFGDAKLAVLPFHLLPVERRGDRGLAARCGEHEAAGGQSRARIHLEDRATAIPPQRV